MPGHSLAPIGHVPQFPRCQLSNGASHIALASVPAKLETAMEIVFTGEFLLMWKTDILMARHSLAPVRHVSQSCRCQHSNRASHNLLVLASAELPAAMEVIFTGEFLLTLKTDI
ncbi:hypothetical protein L873DRAFT_1795509 [Choiromyces venosus 120613-1]|uniref:Uncharacterized protein n=1 Tax=Choiromyces venosus 120613-1 TaxID=1336337 RepID=A0A3N4IWZ2_9PEZI|nr:hypothetical protein L873DRAFT_1795509 [Choiromyces venosus 120613-1]